MATSISYVKNLLPNALMLKLGNSYVNINPGTAIPLADILISDPSNPGYNKDRIDNLVDRRILAIITVTK